GPPPPDPGGLARAASFLRPYPHPGAAFGLRSGGGEARAPAEVLTDEPDRDGALAARGRRPLHRAAADVPRSEHARCAGLQQVGVAVTAGPRRSVPRVRVGPGSGDGVAA